MKKYWEIFYNPFGIAFFIGHWACISLVSNWKLSRNFGGIISPANTLTIFNSSDNFGIDLFVLVNFPSIVFVKSLFVLISPLFDPSLDIDRTAFNYFAVCSTFQWLLIGYVINCKINSYRKSEITKISLKNE